MRIPYTRQLWLKLWLAVVAALAVVTLVFGWIARMERNEVERERQQRPGREIVLRDASGEILGQALVRPSRVTDAGGGPGLEYEVPLSAPLAAGQTIYVLLPRPEPRFGHGRRLLGASRAPSPPPPAWWQPPYSLPGLLMTLVAVAAAVALGAWPVVRKLTRRLETLQRGVEQWGEGDLAIRLPEDGGDEVAFLAQRFNIAAERVQALLLAHKTLLANASHELRSPLARIRMGLELLPQGGAPNPAALEEIARNIRELDALIDEILLASRLDAGPQDLGPMESVDLLGLAAEECARVDAELIAESGAVNVTGHPRLLRRALRNLLENARRHGAGEVSLTLRLITKGQASTAEVRVRDQGPGVPADLRERIFEPFFRLPGASERDGGAGLGLALVRSIALRHGGSVHCEDAAPSSPGKNPGACFVLSLPGSF